MIEDLYARFLPQFLAVARTRMAVATTAATERDHAKAQTIVRELHALAGEAGLLGLHHVIPLARACEAKAKALRGSESDADADALIAALRELKQAIDAIAGAPPR